jgi:serine/threonine protein kinase
VRWGSLRLVSYPISHDAVRQAFAEWDVDVAPLGVGGFKNAYAVRHHDRGDPVVLKVVRQPLGVPATDTSGGEATLPEWFLREIAAMRTIDSPRVVRILDGPGRREIEGADRVWYLEPYFQGSLSDRLTGRWAEVDTARMMLDVLDGIAALSDAHLVHRDIKPDNIVFDAVGRAVLLDLGIALHLDMTRLTGPDEVGPRTPAYAAPEQFEVRRLSTIDFRTDLFLLGVVAFQVRTGLHPFRPDLHGYLERLFRGEYDQDALDASGASDSFKAMIRRLLGPNANQRYRKIEFARQAIENCI